MNWGEENGINNYEKTKCFWRRVAKEGTPAWVQEVDHRFLSLRPLYPMFYLLLANWTLACKSVFSYLLAETLKTFEGFNHDIILLYYQGIRKREKPNRACAHMRIEHFPSLHR